jgi:hypothetical protein
MSDATDREPQSWQHVARVVGDTERQSYEKNLAILDILAPLEKSSGSLQVLKRATRGPMAALAGGPRSEVRSQKVLCAVRERNDWSDNYASKCENRWRSWRCGRPGKNPRGIWRFSRPPPDRQVAAWERARFGSSDWPKMENAKIYIIGRPCLREADYNRPKVPGRLKYEELS